MPPRPITPEDQAKLDAWIVSIRQLARIHKCAHKTSVANILKSMRTHGILVYTHREIHIGLAGAGIPEEELTAVYTLIYG